MTNRLKFILLVSLFSIGLLAIGIATSSSSAKKSSLKSYNSTQLHEKIENDLKNLTIYRKGLKRVLSYVHKRSDLFPKKKIKKSRFLSGTQREEVRSIWKSYLDYLIALDSLGMQYSKFYKLKTSKVRRGAFLVSHGAFLAQYRYSLDLLDRMENDPALDKVLNEEIPEIGLPKGTYRSFKFRFLNVARAGEFAASKAVYHAYGRAYGDDYFPEIRLNIKEDSSRILKAGRGRGTVLTYKNGLQIIRKSGMTAWFPVQQGASELMGDIKVWRKHRSLINQKQIKEIIPQLEPGDIMLQRREWYLTNVGLPGFWTHAALYVGTAQERQQFFKEKNVEQWVKQRGESSGEFEKLFKKKYPKAFSMANQPTHDGNLPRIIEAVGEGVLLTSIEYSALADSIAVLRPRLSKKAKAKALLGAFKYYNYPYDFNFDFLTDSSVVCTELVYKAYEPRKGFKGLHFDLGKLMGRYVLPANDIAKKFDLEADTEKQDLDFVLFLDGFERKKIAIHSTATEFQKSWGRPKWHVLLQETAAK